MTFPVEEPSDNLADYRSSQGEGDEFPAEAGFDAEIDDEGDGDVDVEIPAEGEFFIALPQVAERYVNGQGEQNEAY
jgi:hypothetical protein